MLQTADGFLLKDHRKMEMLIFPCIWLRNTNMLKIVLFFTCFYSVWGQKVLKEKTSNEDLRKENESQQPPHIILMLADDLGWNDVSFHGSPQIPTPNIDALAASSIVLNNYYTECVCTPSRAAWMTGRYPINTGLQHFIIKSGEATGLPLQFKIMPQFLKDLGYATHMVGKWHLGYYKKDYTPINRGFDSFFGLFNGMMDYFDYTNFEDTEIPNGIPYYGIDLHEGDDIITDRRGRYSTDVFTERAVKLIQNHNESKPLFLYLAHTAPHTANSYMPLQAPVSYVQKVKHIKDQKRRIFGGVISALDASVGKVVETLSQKGFLQNSILVFCSDNGGENSRGSQGSNWPLRGQKLSSFEGGVRVPCLLWSPLLKLTEPRTATQLMHVSDWLPTLYSAAGGEVSDLGEIDGLNMWDAIINNLPSSRIEVLHNIDPIYDMYAIRRGDFKLVAGTLKDKNFYWNGPSGFEDTGTPLSMDEWVFKNDSIVKKIFEESGFWLIKNADNWRRNTVLKCHGPPPRPGADGCFPNIYPCLFNIPDDPCEYRNIAFRYPRIVRSLMERIRCYDASAMIPLSKARDPLGDPRCHNFTFVSWKDADSTSSCPFT